MRNCIKASTSLLAILCCLAGVAEAKTARMNDFAYGIPLQVDGDGAVYSLALPDDVYRYSQYADLADLRVFNGHGEVVPHLLQRPPTEATSGAALIKAPLYPLPAYEGKPLEEEAPMSIGDEGPLIDYYGGRLPLPGAGAGEYFLVDAAQYAGAVARLHLRWQGGEESLVTEVSVDVSDDLTHWQPLLERQAVATLFYRGYRLEHHALELPAAGGKYYRIHWPPGSRGVALQGVGLELRAAQESPVQRQRLLPLDAAAAKLFYEFRLPGYFPVSGSRLLLAQRNRAIEGRLFSRTDDNTPWQLRYQGLFYDLQRQGQRLRNAVIEMAPASHSQWRLEIESNENGRDVGVPELELVWRPQRLLFVARGEMPFTLAFGRYGAEPEQPAIDPLLRRINHSQKGMIKAATAGVTFELGGADRLIAAAPPLSWRKWLLWGGLLLGVGVLGGMVRSLYRQMK